MKQSLDTALYQLLRPLVEILIAQQYDFSDLNVLIKRVYVDTVTDGMISDNITPTDAKIAIQTGFTRKLVAELRKEKLGKTKSSNYNRVNRVINGWMHDVDFQDKKGRPAILSESNTGISLKELINRYSGDMPFNSMKDEMIRVGVIEERGEHLWELIAQQYLSNKNTDEGLSILGEDVGLLISTIGNNLENSDATHFQRKVKYDNIPIEQIEPFRKFSARENQKLLVKLNKWLASKDRDVYSDVVGSGKVTLGVGVYYFETIDDDGSDVNRSDNK